MSNGPSDPKREELTSDVVWYGSLAVAALTIIGILVVLGIILSGATDPQPVGELMVDDAVLDGEAWPDLIAVSDGRSGFGIAPAWTIDTTDIPEPFSVPGTLEVSLQQVSGPPEGAYGLTWQADRGKVVIIKLNANGYLGITRTYPDDTVENIYTWRPFPHVHGMDQANRIWVTVKDGQAVVRINEEVAVAFDEMPDGRYSLSWYAETFEEGGLEVAVEGFRLWAEP